jgi:hypothetical protein
MIPFMKCVDIVSSSLLGKDSEKSIDTVEFRRQSRDTEGFFYYRERE